MFGWTNLLLFAALAAACGQSTRNQGKPAAGGSGGEGGSAPSTAGAQSTGGDPSNEPVAGAPASGGQSEGGAGPSSEGGHENDGGASEVGGAGAGGEGGALLPSPVCDDGNACTVDSFVADGCQHEPAPDGQLCDDGDLCTLGDHCQEGACVPGALQSGPGQALGDLQAFGLGLTVTPGDDHFVFVDTFDFPGRVTVGQVQGDRLEKRGATDIDPAVGSSFIAAAWDDLVAVADGDTSYGLNGPARDMQLFTIEADGSLTPHTVTPITPGSTSNPANTSMTGRGSRLLLCHNWSFFTAPAGTLMWWDVSDPDLPVLVAEGPTNGQCGSIAASVDGERVYVNTVNGVRWTDLSTWTSGPITFATDPLVAMDAGLHVLGDTLVARSGEQLHVFDESDHTLLHSFTVAGANGAALTDAGIVVMSDVATGGGTENALALYDLSGTLLQRVVTSKLAYARDITSQKAIAGAGYAMDVATRRLFAVSPSGFDELHAPGLGAMTWAFAGTDALHLRSNLAASTVDVSDPAAPALLAGGPTREPALGIKLDVSLPPGKLIGETDPPTGFFASRDPTTVLVETNRGHATATPVQVVNVDADEHYVAMGSFELPGGSATLLSAGDFVYRVPDEAGAVHLQRWQLRDLQAGIGAPQMDLTFDGPATGKALVRFDVDPSARLAVLTTRWVDDATTVGKLYWIDLAMDPPSVVETTDLAAAGVLIRGSRLVYVETTTTGDALHFRERGTDLDAVFQTDQSITRLLAFDGTTVYYAVTDAIRAVTHKPPTAPAQTLDLPMRGAPTSLVAMPNTLVATSPGQLLTLAPACE
jgi:hypothetical protein